MKTPLGLAIAVCCAVLLGSVLLVRTTINLTFSQRIQVEEPTLFVVQHGQSATAVLSALYQTYPLEGKWWMKVALKLDPSLSMLKQGTYEIAPGDTLASFWEALVAGNVKRFFVTVIEGQTFAQWLSKLNALPQLQPSLLSPLQWPEAMAKPEGGRLEGWLLPDTYAYSAGDSVEDIILRAHSAMQAYLMSAWQSRAIDLPIDSPYEALTLASIVEKETGQAHERPLIAGVFMNRIRQKMRLQTDPTVIYGLGDAFDGDITRKHLRQPTPYNTYVIKGLPPTPIAMPSRAAIDAVMHPQHTSALYFVAKGDGSHVFSDNLADHNKAVRQYQLNQ